MTAFISSAAVLVWSCLVPSAVRTASAVGPCGKHLGLKASGCSPHRKVADMHHGRLRSSPAGGCSARDGCSAGGRARATLDVPTPRLDHGVAALLRFGWGPSRSPMLSSRSPLV